MKRLPSLGLGRPCSPNASPKRVGLLLLFLSAGVLFVEPCRGGSGGFDETGSLINACYEHTATSLPNGKVLVTGGDVTGSGAGLYDPASGTWAATGNLVTYRTRHTATLLPNGKVLVAAGGNLDQTATAELYDPASGRWTQTGSLIWKRSEHTATLLPNGKVLVVGGLYIDVGYGGFSLVSAALYDPATGTWTETAALATSRFRHTATLLPDGKVLVAGGYNDNYGMGLRTLASCELYDPQSGTWTTTGTLGEGRDQHTATLLPDGRVLVAGGDRISNSPSVVHASAELYDPASGTWTPTGALTTARCNHTSTLLPDGTVLAAGGQNTFGYNGVGLDSGELYDPVSGTWTATGHLGARRKDHTATLLPNNKVLVAGGNDSDNAPIASAELYVGPPTLLNISTRLPVQTGANAMIGGFILVGTQKAVIVRGIGPSLGVPGALADPVIEMHGPTGEIYATNDNWRSDPNYQHVIDSGIAPTNDSEAAFWGIVNPGAYTVTLRGANGASGIGLVEVYGLGQGDGARLANISTRGLVETGDDVMIGGLIVGGGPAGDTARVLLRALGPSVPVAGALADPILELRNASGMLVASNDNWKTRADGSSQEAEIVATTIPPPNDLESAIVGPLPAGNYTAIVRGKNNTTGVGLVEAYHLQ